MSLKAIALHPGNFVSRGRNIVLIAFSVCALFLTACDITVKKVEAKTAEDSMEAFLTYQDVLVGKDSEAVKRAFGKPKGIFEKREGKIWMYSRWRIEFDSQDRVVRLERDIAAASGWGAAATASMVVTPRPVAPSRPAPSSESVIRISQGGQTVDLHSLMVPGRITVVDFYADWCGPCQRIAPYLEKLAHDDPDVMLVQVDIVKWGTPVAKQHNINSVPNIRVFDRNRKLVGQPTSSFSAVQSYVQKAGG